MGISERDVLQWDVASWRPALEYWETRIGRRPVGAALELGARDGGVSLWLAHHAREVVCSDIDPRSSAQDLHRACGLTNVRYEMIDARSIPYREAFDVIVFKSMVGALGVGSVGWADRRHAFLEMHAALRDGGLLLFAENLAASPLHRALRGRFVSWADGWGYVTRAELRAHLQAFREVEICVSGVSSAFGRTERQRSILAGFDQLVLNRIMPADWKYVAYGSAVK